MHRVRRLAELLNVCLALLKQIGSGLVKAVYGGRHNIADLVPVDLTANAMISVGWYTALSK
jgi:hypothetical protein